MEINTTGYTEAAKRYLAEIRDIVPIPPKNGKEYTLHKQRYITGENSSVLLNEQKANLAKVMADNPEMSLPEVYVRAGYSYASYFNEGKNVKRIKANLTSNCRGKITPDVKKLSNYLKYGAAEELLIDATWVLNENVSLYEECRRSKNFTQAARILENIATHVDVDSKVSNRLVVEGTVDYAAILQQADNRLAVDTSTCIEGEVVKEELEHQ